MKKQILKNLIILLLAPAVGFVLLLLVHLLPTDTMKSNVISSKDTIIAEGKDELVIDDYNATLTGNFTDCIMLQLAIYDGGHSALDQSVNLYRNEVGNETEWCPGLSLADYLNGGNTNLEVKYPRYWHGYLVLLKPLLLFTSFNSVRLLNAGLELMLLAAVLIVFSKKGYASLAASLAFSIPFLFFFSSFASLSLSICIYIMLVSLLLTALFNDRFTEKEGYITLFLLTGVACAYFDFLTYPLVTLAFPLVAVLAMNEEKTSKSYIAILKYSVSWGTGYAFMWASKWIAAAVFTGRGAITDAVNTIFARTSPATGSGRISGFVKVIAGNFSPYANRAFALIILAVIIVIAVIVLKTGIRKSFSKPASAIPYAVVGLTPFVWWFVTSNHSYEHWAFTCRNFAVFVFAITYAFIKNASFSIEKKD